MDTSTSGLFNNPVLGDHSDIPITLDDALEMNKVGFYQYRLLLLCGFAFMADALEVNLLSFLSVCAGKEWDLSDAEEASITGIVFAGIVCGSGFWGILSDKYGRKIAFIFATTIITVGGGLVGFGIGGANVPFDLLAELLPVSQRGGFLVYIEYFWTFGSILVAGLAWACLSQSGWRTLALLTVIPVGITSLLSIIYLPESPRWLLAVGRNTEAEKIISDAAAVNGVKMPSFRLRNDQELHAANVDYLDIVKEPHLRKVTLPLWMVWAGFGCTYYGIILFVTRLYSTSSDDDDSDTCTFDYSSIFYNALSEVGAVTFNGLVLEHFGRVKMQTVFYALSAVTVFCMGLGIHDGALVAVGMIGRIAVMIASSTTWVATPELYATEYRTIGHATCVSFSKIGAMVSPYIVISALDPIYVGIILAAVNLIAACSAWCLPETTGIKLGLLDEAKSADKHLENNQQKVYDFGDIDNSDVNVAMSENKETTKNPVWVNDL
eukprot:gene7298-7875_t